MPPWWTLWASRERQRDPGRHVRADREDVAEQPGPRPLGDLLEARLVAEHVPHLDVEAALAGPSPSGAGSRASRRRPACRTRGACRRRRRRGPSPGSRRCAPRRRWRRCSGHGGGRRPRRTSGRRRTLRAAARRRGRRGLAPRSRPPRPRRWSIRARHLPRACPCFVPICPILTGISHSPWRTVYRRHVGATIGSASVGGGSNAPRRFGSRALTRRDDRVGCRERRSAAGGRTGNRRKPGTVAASPVVPV